jgi:hypothetical protein
LVAVASESISRAASMARDCATSTVTVFQSV